MKKLVLAFLLGLIFSSAVLSAPNIVMYRYEGKDLRDVSNVIAVDGLTIDPWVRDDTKWPADKKIVLFVHGFSMFSQGKCRNGLIALAAHLSQDRKVDDVVVPSYSAIYIAEYPVDYSIIETAASFADIINDRCSSLSKDVKIDVFAHSLGGLVARAAIEYPEVRLGTKSIAGRVGHLVTMGTPHNGLGLLESKIFREVLEKLPVEISDIDSTGQFIKILNSTSAKKPKVLCDYYSIVGARSYRPEKYLSGKIGPFAMIIKKIADKKISVHDGLINADSAGYDLSEVCHAFKKTPLDLNHDYIKSHAEVFDVIDRWMIDDGWFGAASEKSASQVEDKSYDDLYSVPIESFASGFEGFLLGLGKAIAFISNRDGEAAIYAKDIDKNDCYKIASLSGMKEQFSISSGDNIILLGNDGKFMLLLIDKKKDFNQSFHHIYQKMINVDLDISTEFFPFWDSNESFFCLFSDEVKKASFQVKQVSPTSGLSKIFGDKLQKLTDLTDKIIGKKTKVEWKEESIKDEVQFITSKRDEQGCSRICIVDRFNKVKQWLSPTGLNAGEPQVGQAGAIIPLGGGMGPIVFTSNKDGNQNIYRLDGAGTTQSKITKLTTDPADDHAPFWAYFTKKIYFTSKRSGVCRIYEMKGDGTEQKMIDLR